jgi:hypothetical protein
MNTMNVNASLHNLLQMDRHQEESNRIPVIHQAANAEVERETAARRPEMANQPEQPDGKNVDSEGRKRYQREAPKRKPQKKKTNTRGKTDGAGRFVDVIV